MKKKVKSKLNLKKKVNKCESKKGEKQRSKGKEKNQSYKAANEID